MPESSNCIILPVTQRQPTRQRTTNATEINKQSAVLEQLVTDQFDPWQVVPRQVFTPYSRLLISTAFVVVIRVVCLGYSSNNHYQLYQKKVMYLPDLFVLLLLFSSFFY